MNKAELRKQEISGIEANLAALKGKSHLSDAEQATVNQLEEKLLNLKTLVLTQQALETPLSPEALAITSPGPQGKTS